MRVNYIDSGYTLNNVNVGLKPHKQKTKITASAVPNSKMVKLTFTGKNMKQLASFTPENNGLGLAEASQGGEGCVGYEVVASMRKHEDIDARSFMPFWEYNNPEGGYKFLIHRKADFPDGVSKLPDEIPAKFFLQCKNRRRLGSCIKKIRNTNRRIELCYTKQTKRLRSRSKIKILYFRIYKCQR